MGGWFETPLRRTGIFPQDCRGGIILTGKKKNGKGERKKSGKSYCYDIGGTDTPQIETSGQKGFACENKKVPSKLIFVEMLTDFGALHNISTVDIIIRGRSLPVYISMGNRDGHASAHE